MRPSRRLVLISSLLLGGAAAAAAGCGSDGNGGGTGGTGGASAGSGGATPGSGGASAGSGGASPGSGGASAGTGGASAGSGGATAGSGGATGSGGLASGSGGAAAGSGGATAGSGGRGGGATGGAGGGGGGSSGTAHAMMNFFVTSDTRPTGNLGGLAGSDMRCQMLAMAVGHGSKTWRAYLSVATPPTNARDRIGDGPYYNSVGMMLAANKNALHMINGDPALFLDEKGNRINGQWANSPTPNQHDVMTGATRDGMLQTGATCGDWMSTTGAGQAGHTDGLGPNMSMTGNVVFWNSAHASSGNCGDTSIGGGAGKVYCFVGP
jgi:hypothetical protein